MSTVSKLPLQKGRSGSGPRHQRRQDVMRYYLDRALHETPLTLEGFTEALGHAYESLVPEFAQHVKLGGLHTRMPHVEYAARLGKQVKVVQRYMDPDGPLHFPAELEEAWVMALPDGYSQACRVELVNRHGCVGAKLPSAEGAANPLAGTAQLTDAHGRALTLLAKVIADGVIDERDAPYAEELMVALRQVEGYAESLYRQLEAIARDMPAAS